MPLDPLLVQFALILGLSLFFGLAFEDFHAHSGLSRPGGIRTFPLLALAGGLLYLLDTDRKLPLVAGLLVLGAWLVVAYRRQVGERVEDDRSAVELVAPICNVLAYLIGPAALTLPPWLVVAVTVTAVLLLTGRRRLHALAQRVPISEIVTATQFLILTGIVLPLLPNHPVTTLTAITPYKAWLALLVVCTLSYASYLMQRFVTPARGDLMVALLGGLYSSTATTVVLARAAAAKPATNSVAQAGIILATAIMYLRILAIVAIFDLPLALGIAPAAVVLSLAGVGMAALQYRRARRVSVSVGADRTRPHNPLEPTAAAVFAVLFVVTSIATQWVQNRFGALGVNALAAVVGFVDIDPFVLNLAQSGPGGLPLDGLISAVLIAMSSNNVLKAACAAVFAGWRASLPAAVALLVLAAGGIGAALIH
ncbi:MAG: MgtC/SapB family protein [Stellaceae bacterium]